MTRLPNGRFTRGSTADMRTRGVPLLKSDAHLRAWRTRRAKRAEWVAAHVETLRRSM